MAAYETTGRGQIRTTGKYEIELSMRRWRKNGQYGLKDRLYVSEVKGGRERDLGYVDLTEPGLHKVGKFFGGTNPWLNEEVDAALSEYIENEFRTYSDAK